MTDDVAPQGPTLSAPIPSGTDLTLSLGELTAGQTGQPLFADYDLLAEIARGGMGVVYKARDRRLNRVVALKLTRAGRQGSAADRRLLAEAEAAAKLDHPNIVPIYEVGAAGDQHFFSMAYVEGPSLAQAVVSGPLIPRRAAEILRQVADAVAYAHARGVIHRDLKPGNILLDASGQPRVTDFGLAKQADADSSLTLDGQIVGTPSFMPPEQAEGKIAEIGPAADVYGLGATLYHLVAGRPPFQAATVPETLAQVVDRDPIGPRSLNPAVDLDLDTIILKCLEKRPEKRYASAGDLSADLQRYLAGRPILARPVGDVERAARWARRNPLAAGSLAGIAAIFLAAFVLVSWSYVRADAARKDAVAEREKAEAREKAERWERYRSNLGAASTALRTHNVVSARDALDAAPPEYRGWEWRHFRQQLDSSRTTWAKGPGWFGHSLSPDARRVAIGLPSSIRIWDTAAQTEIDLREPAHGIPIIAWGPGGRTVAFSLDSRDEVAVWDLAANARVLTVPAKGPVRVYGLSPDGRHLAIGTDDGTIRVREVPSGGQLWASPPARIEDGRLAFSPDGRRVAVTGWTDRSVRLWDVDGGRATISRGGEAASMDLAFAPDGSRLATAERYPSNAVRVWNSATGALVAVLHGHTNVVYALAFSPDGRRIVTAGWDQTARLWETETGRPIAVLAGHSGWVYSAAFSPDGRRVVTAGSDRTVRLWDGGTGDALSVLHGHTEAVFQAAFTSDGATLVSVAYGDSVRLWDAAAAERQGTLRGHENFVYGVAAHPDGNRLASAAWDGTVRVWDANAGREIATFRHAPGTIVTSVAFHPDGDLLASLGRDGVRVWDLATGREVARYPVADAETYKDTRLAYSRRGDRLAYWDRGRAVRIRDTATGAETMLTGPEDAVMDVVFARDDSWLAAADQLGNTYIWPATADGWGPARTLRTTKNMAMALAVSPDGRRLAVGQSDGSVYLWDTTTWEQAGVVKCGARVYGVAFTPDGTRLAAACSDNAIRLWDMATGQAVAELYGHTDYVHQIAFSSDGTRLFSASGDRTVRIWDTLSAQDRIGR